MRGLTFALIAAAAIAGAATTASAQLTQAGVSAAVRGQIALARASQNIVGRQVQSGDAIFLGDAITSGKASGLQIMLLDETVFTIGPNSEISIDEFVYDPATSAGKVTASVAKGVFRFITGKIARKRPEDMTVRLPTATIGIRGTIVAGAVRTGAGVDPDVDRAFAGLKGVVDGVENALDFVVLLGPGDENNTNDKGGAFVYRARGAEKAERGRNAGSLLAQLTGFGAGDSGVTVSRSGYGVASNAAGRIFGPFPAPPEVTQAFTGGLGAQPAGGAKGKSTDSNAQEANSASDADSLSGNSFAVTLMDGLQTDKDFEDNGCIGGGACDPSASGDAAFDFSDLRNVSIGNASFNKSSAVVGPFLVGSIVIDINFGNQTFNFLFNNISGGGISPLGAIFSNSPNSYSNRSGIPLFTSDDANVTKTGGCDDCNLTMVVTSASSPSSATINATLEHQGVTGSKVIVSN